MNFTKYLSFFLVFGAIVIAGPLHAQVIPSINGLQVDINPIFPQAGQSVMIEIRNYNTDLDSATITWFKNDKVASEGIGQKSFNLIAPQSGNLERVRVKVKTIEGLVLEKIIDIKSGSVDLILEPNGYVQPFFKGKAPIAYQNIVKIIAVPHITDKNGVEILPSQLVYKWSVGSKIIESSSGYGRQVFKLEQNVIAKPYQVTVNVSSRDGSSETENSININSTDPSILFYAEDPLYGVMYNKMAGEVTRFFTKEARITAVPFGFNKEEISSSEYMWEIGGERRPELGKNRSVLLRTKDDVGVSGSEITLDIRNNTSILQGAKNSFNVIFNTQNADSSINF